MAIQNKSLSAAEHDWFATRSGVVSHAPLNDHKRAYFASKGISGANAKKTSQMELEWLHTLTGVSTKNTISDLWREAVAGQSLTPSVNINQNKFIFFTQVTTNP